MKFSLHRGTSVRNETNAGNDDKFLLVCAVLFPLKYNTLRGMLAYTRTRLNGLRQWITRAIRSKLARKKRAFARKGSRMERKWVQALANSRSYVPDDFRVIFVFLLFPVKRRGNFLSLSSFTARDWIGPFSILFLPTAWQTNYKPKHS